MIYFKSVIPLKRVLFGSVLIILLAIFDRDQFAFAVH